MENIYAVHGGKVISYFISCPRAEDSKSSIGHISEGGFVSLTVSNPPTPCVLVTALCCPLVRLVDSTSPMRKVPRAALLFSRHLSSHVMGRVCSVEYVIDEKNEDEDEDEDGLAVRAAVRRRSRCSRRER